DARQRLLDVQRAVAAPIEEAEGRVAGLLHLREEHAAADRVDRAGGQKDAVARPRREAVQAVGDPARRQRLAQVARLDTRQQAGEDAAARLGVQDEPRLGL